MSLDPLLFVMNVLVILFGTIWPQLAADILTLSISLLLSVRDTKTQKTGGAFMQDIK